MNKKAYLLAAVFASMLLQGCSCRVNEDYEGSSSGVYDRVGEYPEYGDPDAYIAEGTQEEFVIAAGDRVLFRLNSSDIDEDQMSVIKNQAEWLRRNDSFSVVVEGHCDERGTREYNIALGERRANSVKKALVQQSIDESRISVVSYGKDRPAVEGHNEEAWRLNRRSVTRVLGDSE